MSRLTIDITDQQHKALKATAAMQGKTIKQYAIERLFSEQPDDAQAWRDLRAFLNQRIDAGLAGKVSTLSVDAIVDEVLTEDSTA